VCFVAGSVRDFVEQQAAQQPGRYRRGASAVAPTAAVLVDTEGGQVGSGAPYYRYTVVQRRGLGIAAPRPLYVLGIDAEANQVTVGPHEALEARGLLGDRVHWISGEAPAGPVLASVRIRSRHRGVESSIRLLENGRVEIEFAQPQVGVAPGQAAVFYRDTQVLGGCWIEAPVR
jgi:tRNA-specific 2-thiouridylase